MTSSEFLRIEADNIKVYRTETKKRMYAIANELEALRKAITGILEIGKRDMTNSKYDSYFETLKAALKINEY